MNKNGMSAITVVGLLAITAVSSCAFTWGVIFTFFPPAPTTNNNTTVSLPCHTDINWTQIYLTPLKDNTSLYIYNKTLFIGYKDCDGGWHAEKRVLLNYSVVQIDDIITYLCNSTWLDRPYVWEFDADGNLNGTWTRLCLGDTP